MKVIINGEQNSCPPESTIDTVIQQYKLPELSFVVELNGEIVDKDTYLTRSLKDGDKLEIIRFVGGG